MIVLQRNVPVPEIPISLATRQVLSLMVSPWIRESVSYSCLHPLTHSISPWIAYDIYSIDQEFIEAVEELKFQLCSVLTDQSV